MQYNYDCHLHHQLVDASQMLGEFESFYYNGNLHYVSQYEKPNILPDSHLIWYIDSQIPGKRSLIVFKKVIGERGNSFLYPFSEKTLEPMSS